MKDDATVLAWTDVETTGLNPWTGEELLEIAVLVTDTDLNLLDEEGRTFTVLAGSPAEVALLRAKSDPFVQQMHDRTGLWGRVCDPDEALPLTDIDTALTEYIRQFAPQRRTARVAGNSVRLDMNFLEANLPRFYDHAHYRVLDVTGLAASARWWGQMEVFKKEGTHTAMADIRESLAEARAVKEFWTGHRTRRTSVKGHPALPDLVSEPLPWQPATARESRNVRGPGQAAFTINERRDDARHRHPRRSA